MTVYAVIYYNGESYEDYEESLEGIFSTREKAEEWINTHPVVETNRCHPSRDIAVYNLDDARDASVFTF